MTKIFSSLEVEKYKTNQNLWFVGPSTFTHALLASWHHRARNDAGGHDAGTTHLCQQGHGQGPAAHRFGATNHGIVANGIGTRLTLRHGLKQLQGLNPGTRLLTRPQGRHVTQNIGHLSCCTHLRQNLYGQRPAAPPLTDSKQSAEMKKVHLGQSCPILQYIQHLQCHIWTAQTFQQRRDASWIWDQPLELRLQDLLDMLSRGMFIEFPQFCKRIWWRSWLHGRPNRPPGPEQATLRRHLGRKMHLRGTSLTATGIQPTHHEEKNQSNQQAWAFHKSKRLRAITLLPPWYFAIHDSHTVPLP